jgi:hypothetical protein
VRLLFTAMALALVLAPVASRQLTAIRVSAGDDLQAALDAASPGDTILLQPGARFVGNYVLPNRGAAASFITIRTETAEVPPPGVRTGPQYSGRLAVIQSPDVNPALRTAPGAHHWRIENIEFRASANGGGDIIALGAGGERQRQMSDVPHTIVLDRVLVKGDPRLGQKRGVSLNSRATEIVNSYFADIKAIGQDAQAIAGWNGPGPFTIENNYIEAAGENVLFGGADPGIDGLVPASIAIRRNHFTRPTRWRDALLAAPSGVRATTAAVGGTLAPGEYAYRVAAEQAATGGRALSEPSAATSVRVQSASGTVAVEWAPVPDAASYRVYRRDAAGTEMWWRTETTRFTDTGAPGTTGSPRAASLWTVKNLLELKNARDVVIEGNLFENHWAQSQNGYAIVFTPRNQDGAAPWSRVENVRFTNNVVRQVSAFLNLTGADDVRPSGRTRGIVIRNNLLIGVGVTGWGGNGDFVQLGHGPVDIVIEQNTVAQTGRMLSVYGSELGRTIEGLVFRNNVLRHNRYGVIGADAAPGQDTFTKYLPGAVFTGNVIAGGRASSYPRDNHFIGEDEFAPLFADLAAGNYRLKEGVFAGAGVNVTTLEAASGLSTSEAAAPAVSRQSSR